MAEEEVDRRRAVRCRAKTVDGKRSGLGEVRDRHDESDFGAEKDLDFVADHMDWRGGFAGALLLLVVILVVFHILRKKGVIGHRRKGRHSGRHGAVAERIQPVKEWGAESENEDYVNPDTASTQDSESVQETSSEGSDA